MSENRWLFKDRFNSNERTKAGPSHIQTIIKFSKQYNDGINLTLEKLIGEEPEACIECHTEILCLLIHHNGI